MEVQVTFDTSVPKDLSKLREVIGMEGIAELSAEGSVSVDGPTASADAGPDIEEELSELEEEIAEEFGDEAEGEQEDESDISEEDLPDQFTLGSRSIHLRFKSGEKAGQLTRGGQVALYLLQNPWSSTNEIAEGTGLHSDDVNSVLTGQNQGRMFSCREPMYRDLHGNAMEWFVIPAAYNKIVE